MQIPEVRRQWTRKTVGAEKELREAREVAKVGRNRSFEVVLADGERGQAGQLADFTRDGAGKGVRAQFEVDQ